MPWLILVALGWLQTSAAAPACIRNSGKTACGYNCQAAHGQVACSRMLSGVCAASSEGVVCWDPPDWARAHYGEKLPRPHCITRAGQTQCGYHCQAHDDQINCAQSPDGVCRATALGVTCWDPPPSAYCADDLALPRPMCVTLDDAVACGYACQVRNGQLACASTPGGRCEVVPEGIVCFDPDLSTCGVTPCVPEAAERSWCVKAAVP